MRKRRWAVSSYLAAAVMLSLCLTGCGESKAAKEARLQGITQMSENNYAGAVTSFDTALKEADGKINKFELDILKYRGEAEYKLGNYAAAEHTYGILADVDGEQPEYLYYRAAAGALAGDADAAIVNFDKASQQELVMNRNVKGAVLALSAIGKAYTDNGEYEKAIAFFQRTEESQIADAGIYNQMGLCMIEAEKYEEALRYFDKGIALEDETAAQELSYNKAAVYEYMGDFAKALELFRTHVSKYGSTPELEREIIFLESR